MIVPSVFKPALSCDNSCIDLKSVKLRSFWPRSNIRFEAPQVMCSCAWSGCCVDLSKVGCTSLWLWQLPFIVQFRQVLPIYCSFLNKSLVISFGFFFMLLLSVCLTQSLSVCAGFSQCRLPRLRSSGTPNLEWSVQVFRHDARLGQVPGLPEDGWRGLPSGSTGCRICGRVGEHHRGGQTQTGCSSYLSAHRPACAITSKARATAHCRRMRV